MPKQHSSLTWNNQGEKRRLSAVAQLPKHGTNRVPLTQAALGAGLIMCNRTKSCIIASSPLPDLKGQWFLHFPLQKKNSQSNRCVVCAISMTRRSKIFKALNRKNLSRGRRLLRRCPNHWNCRASDCCFFQNGYQVVCF